MALQEGRGVNDILEGSSRATGDDPLVYFQFSFDDLVREAIFQDRVVDLLYGLLFRFPEDVHQVRLQLADREGVARVKREGDHRLHPGEVYPDQAVVIGDAPRFEFPVLLFPAVRAVVIRHLFVGAPDRGKAGGLRGHHVDAVAEVDGEIPDPRTDEFHDPVLHEAVFEDGPDDRERHILRPDAVTRPPLQEDGDNFRPDGVVGPAQDLLHQLRAAFADPHAAQRAVAGVAVRTHDHLAATGHPFPHVLVDNRLVGRDVDAAVLLRRREAEEVVILVDRAADRAEAVMAVGQRVRDRKGFQPAGLGRLNDADIGDVVGGQRVETDFQPFALRSLPMRGEDAEGHRGPPGLFFPEHPLRPPKGGEDPPHIRRCQPVLVIDRILSVQEQDSPVLSQFDHDSAFPRRRLDKRDCLTL